MKPYYADESVTLWHGDSLTVLSGLPDASVNCCVTSPPYFGLRDYGVEGQLGLEASPAEYVENLRALFAQVRRVLADDGTLWLNLGDSYMSRQFGWGNNSEGSWAAKHREAGDTRPDGERVGHPASKSYEMSRRSGIPVKNLLGIPWRVAFALQDDGWILRNDIIWAKPNAMPESVTDRLSTKHEHLFLFSKRARYWFDLDPIREQLIRPEALDEGQSFKNMTAGRANTTPYGKTWADRKAAGEVRASRSPEHIGKPGTFAGGTLASSPLGKNPGDVWTIATQPFSEAHFAVMPSALAERAIQAGCKPGGTVLDPFSGSGTTGLAAARHGRKYIGIDLNTEYLDLSLRTRLAQPGLDFDGVA